MNKSTTPEICLFSILRSLDPLGQWPPYRRSCLIQDAHPITSHIASPQFVTSMSNCNNNNSIPSTPPEEKSQTLPPLNLAQQVKRTFVATRRQQLLQEKTEQLKRKNRHVSLKAREIREKRERVVKIANAQMVVQMAAAQERRLQYLESLRQRARASRVMFEAHAAKNPRDGNQPTPLKLTNLLSSNLLRLPRIIRRYQLSQAARALKNCSLLLGSIHQRHLFSEVVTLVRSDASQTMIRFLQALGLPDPTPNRPYAWFLYSFVLVTEFAEAAQNQETYIGAVTTPKLSLNPIVLFHLAVRIHRLLAHVILECEAEIPHAWSVSRLQLARCWRTYTAVFGIFLQDHRRSLRSMTRQALVVAETHQRIMARLGTRDFKSDSKIFLLTLRVLSHTAPLTCVPWALLSEDDASALKVDPDTFRRDNFVQHNLEVVLMDAKLFSFGHHHFYIPPAVEPQAWRNLWYRKFCGDAGIPKIRAGRMKALSEPQILEGSEIAALYSHTDDMTEQSVLDSLNEAYNSALQYGHHFLDRKFESVQIRYQDLSSLAIGSHDVEVRARYLTLFMLLVAEIASEMGCEESFTLGCSWEELSAAHCILRVGAYAQTLLAFVRTKWVQRCQISSKSNAVLFENVMQYAGHGALRWNTGTDFAHLRFPDFYLFVYRYLPRVLGQFLVQSIAQAASQGPNFKNSSPSRAVCNKLFAVVAAYIADPETHPLPKFFCLVADQVEKLKAEARAIVASTWILLLLVLTKSQTRALHEYISRGPSLAACLDCPRLELTKYQRTFLLRLLARQESDRLKNCLHEKIQISLCERTARNFAVMEAEVLELTPQYEALICDFYSINYPLVNWIFSDLNL